MNTIQDVYDLNTEILQGRSIDETTFLVLANLAVDEFEGRRHWRKLIREDTSNSSSTSDTYLTTKTLPTTFKMPLSGRKGLVLVPTAGGTGIPYTETEFALKEINKNNSGVYFIDHYNNTYSICGTVGVPMTHHLYYIARSAQFTALTDTWLFPSIYWSFIAFYVAALHELGMDFDDINARNGNANYQTAERIYKSAVKWDDTLFRAALNL